MVRIPESSSSFPKPHITTGPSRTELTTKLLIEMATETIFDTVQSSLAPRDDLKRKNTLAGRITDIGRGGGKKHKGLTHSATLTAKYGKQIINDTTRRQFSHHSLGTQGKKNKRTHQ
ncbi:MAG: hypothetical protein A3D96_00375 [Chlamydiae bacterium RIFCSPHIGHO2_12_FULL_44_59]|nr:MAG: hypothetical protein A2796_07520 [Chlamydiae bacterium RIFCSPHIGHO2_01_FULL_44_39]OGN59167.1 MAG: hypothetical protein A3C42_05400 [Chlamydiae bacterium RIFCSPHIGHO2_02_FULL_45_9]OGN60836.1 MAG: hypothetical protein A3D96_00375 [Chlamydiae bacterium RIFCSPHIGHO2_12_FULL_44_59]OGN66712.1 MAG: hypothetical protein A2978_03010 [Chlamydiae bacterium RIFCSPLOWO2_01_FULL_44_52]OGN67362.1 MAG: hypothetical protein A3I67_06205 [Chlamydiae bacterium RIFCSPLOWO2_02_FULL_45_22]OGN70637.1 MAG: hyp